MYTKWKAIEVECTQMEGQWRRCNQMEGQMELIEVECTRNGMEGLQCSRWERECSGMEGQWTNGRSMKLNGEPMEPMEGQCSRMEGQRNRLLVGPPFGSIGLHLLLHWPSIWLHWACRGSRGENLLLFFRVDPVSEPPPAKCLSITFLSSL
jgi:hypothetical protein